MYDIQKALDTEGRGVRIMLRANERTEPAEYVRTNRKQLSRARVQKMTARGLRARTTHQVWRGRTYRTVVIDFPQDECFVCFGRGDFGRDAPEGAELVRVTCAYCKGTGRL